MNLSEDEEKINQIVGFGVFPTLLSACSYLNSVNKSESEILNDIRKLQNKNGLFMTIDNLTTNIAIEITSNIKYKLCVRCRIYETKVLDIFARSRLFVYVVYKISKTFKIETIPEFEDTLFRNYNILNTSKTLILNQKKMKILKKHLDKNKHNFILKNLNLIDFI